EPPSRAPSLAPRRPLLRASRVHSSPAGCSSSDSALAPVTVPRARRRFGSEMPRPESAPFLLLLSSPSRSPFSFHFSRYPLALSIASRPVSPSLGRTAQTLPVSGTFGASRSRHPCFSNSSKRQAPIVRASMNVSASTRLALRGLSIKKTAHSTGGSGSTATNRPFSQSNRGTVSNPKQSRHVQSRHR